MDETAPTLTARAEPKTLGRVLRDQGGLGSRCRQAVRTDYAHPEAPDLERYPWWPHVLVKDEVIAAGDALFVPVGWWHHVRALDPSISLASNCFVTPNRFDWYVPARD
jgi:ribosomal protein L16 Arg81 hydroxylase